MMKKMPKGIPNQQLKAERELRGWSQKYVADQIGADHYYLSRWERGTASPSPYYRQKLCTLFGKNAKELGLLQEESSEDLEKRSEGAALSAQAQRAIHDPALPLLSVATTELIGRDEVLSHLKERLCTGKNVGLTALKGLPGVGKTTLAVALAHDGDVQAHFHDGILWAGLGPHPNVLGQLSRWGTLLGTPSIAAARLNSIEAWTQIIRAAIGTRRVLLAVDDAWQIEEALEQESSNIFAALDAASRHDRHADLVRCITAFAWFLQARGLYGQAETYLTQAEGATRLLQDSAGLATALFHLGRIRFIHGDYDQAEATLLEGLFFARQSGDREQMCQILNGLGTIPRYKGDYQQAEVYHREGLALARELGDLVLMSTLLMGVGTDAWENGHYDEAEACLQEGLALARQAGDRERLCETLVNCGSVAYTRGDYAQGDSYSLEALEIARQIGYNRAVTVLLGNLGEIAAERGEYDQARVYLQEALEIALRMEHRELISTTTVNLGRIATEQGNHEQAEAYLQEDWEIARQIGRHRLLCEVLCSWGELHLKQSQWVEAAARFGEVRDSATGVSQEYLAMAIYGLARVAAAQGESREARELGQESLRIAESIGNRLAAQVRAWLDTLQV